MSKAQSSVIWLGLVLVTLNLIIHIGEIKSVIFGGSGGSASAPAQNPGSNATPAPTPNQSPTPSTVQVT
jgi:hypothetical protein